MGKQARKKTQREKHLEEGYEAGLEGGIVTGLTATIYNGFSPYQFTLVYAKSMPGTKGALCRAMRAYNAHLASIVRGYHAANE